MEIVYVPLRVEDLNMLKLMLRVLTVQRFIEAVSRDRTALDVTDLQMVVEVLKFSDIYRTHDHLLMTALESMKANGLGEARVPFVGSVRDFFQEVAQAKFEVGPVVSDVWTTYIKSCVDARDGLLERLAIAETIPGVETVAVANVPPATGRN